MGTNPGSLNQKITIIFVRLNGIYLNISMKHIPNICTLANLMFGCIAIIFILDAPAFLQTTTGEEFYPVLGLQQLYWGSIFIGLAAVMDVLDGLMARMLHAFSPIGKDLDSLADVVSFGVAPSMILYKFLWFAYMKEPGALSTPLIVLAPAFLVACFGALRLARFNQSSAQQQRYFIGMPIPATGILVASLPLIYWFPATYSIGFIFEQRWPLYGLIVLVCYLMVSKIRFFKWMPSGKGIRAWWPQILIVVVLLAGFPFLRFSVVPLAFLVYILLALIPRKEQELVS